LKLQWSLGLTNEVKTCPVDSKVEQGTYSN
jgi:hypothetical protein